MRAATPKLRAAWPLLMAALSVLLGLALSRPASAADACSRGAASVSLAQEVIGVTAVLALHEETPAPVARRPAIVPARGPVVAHDREARLVDLDHGQWVERSSGRDPRALPDSAGTQRRDSGAPTGDAAVHLRWPAPDLACSGVAAEVVNRAARTSEARRDARVRGVHASRGPPEPLARG